MKRLTIALMLALPALSQTATIPDLLQNHAD